MALCCCCASRATATATAAAIIAITLTFICQLQLYCMTIFLLDEVERIAIVHPAAMHHIYLQCTIAIAISPAPFRLQAT